MPYSFGLILLTVSLLLQGWSEKYDRTNNQIFASMIVAKYREKPCGGDFSLHPQDLTLGNRHTFARPITASGLFGRISWRTDTQCLY